jgi:hypothetical protein
MGTSADFGGPTGGAWTTYKHAAARYARLGGETNRNRLLKSYAKAVASGGGGGGGGGGNSGGGGGFADDPWASAAPASGGSSSSTFDEEPPF